MRWKALSITSTWGLLAYAGRLELCRVDTAEVLSLE